MTLSSTALLEYADVETYMSLTADAQDAILDYLINGVSKRIEDYARRNFKSQTYSEIYDRPCHGNELVLRQPDVTAISFIASEWDDAMTVIYSGSDSYARVEVTDASVILTSSGAATSTTTFAAQATTAAMATALDAVSGWDSTALITRPSTYLIRRGATIAKDKTVTLQVWHDYEGDYETNYKAGVLQFTGWGVLSPQVRVDYTAGFSSIPDGVKLTALEMVRDAWFSRTRSSDLQSESLGDYSYTNAIPQIESNPVWTDRLAQFVRWLP